MSGGTGIRIGDVVCGNGVIDRQLQLPDSGPDSVGVFQVIGHGVFRGEVLLVVAEVDALLPDTVHCGQVIAAPSQLRRVLRDNEEPRVLRSGVFPDSKHELDDLILRELATAFCEILVSVDDLQLHAVETGGKNSVQVGTFPAENNALPVRVPVPNFEVSVPVRVHRIQPFRIAGFHRSRQ